MPFEDVKKVWMNGKFVDYKDATVHVFSHVIHYGSGVFEGARCYKTPRGPAVFRLADHTERLYASAKIYRMEIRYSRRSSTRPSSRRSGSTSSKSATSGPSLTAATERSASILSILRSTS